VQEVAKRQSVQWCAGRRCSAGQGGDGKEQPTHSAHTVRQQTAQNPSDILFTASHIYQIR